MLMEVLRRLGKEYDDWILRGFQARAAAVNHINSNNNSRGGSGQATTVPLPMKSGSGFLRTSPAPPPPQGTTTGMHTVMFRASPLQQLVRSVIHAVSLGVAYIVMLLVMSFNGYIIICVILGAGLGKFFCDWMTRPMEVDFGGATGIEEPSVCCS